MKILFMGTPDYAAECLRALYNHEGAEIIGAVTQPDKPKGRGMKMIAPPVKVFAEEKGIPVFQPATLKDGAFEETLRELDPELIIVAAYGKILPKYILDYPVHKCVNAHASLLPRHRGAAPINRAIMDGDTLTGVTSMYMEEGLDTGDMILKIELPITDTDDVGTLHDKLATAAGEAMCKTVDLIRDGSITAEPQSEDGMTYAAKITKDDCVLDFDRPCRKVYDHIRSLAPVPCAFTHTPDGKLLKFTSAEMTDVSAVGKEPGCVVSVDGGIVIACADGCVKVTGVIPEGKGRMSAADFIRGRKIAEGDVLN